MQKNGKNSIVTILMLLDYTVNILLYLYKFLLIAACLSFSISPSNEYEGLISLG